jgi:EAL domain-containing protein (putative c-di-GMP-specific phosphodiesterase class I)/GGDEF domain-containing protein
MNNEHGLDTSPLNINDIIKDRLVQTVYQPIIRLMDGEVIGYEALSRGPRNTPFESPVVLLSEAENHHCLWELELLFRKLAIERAVGLKQGQQLFLNVDPRIINDPEYSQGLTKEVLNAQSLSPSSIIFEITERYTVKDHDAFSKIMNNYRDQGYGIAIDDAGAGYSGMHTIAVIKPQYVKIDMEIIRNVNADPLRQAIVKSFVLLGQTANIRIVAEGIETREELKTLIQLGVFSGQGYYLKRPVKEIGPLTDAKKEEIITINRILQNQMGYSSNYHFIGNLAVEQMALSSETQCSILEDRFRKDGVEAYCLVDEERVVGMMTQNQLFQAMSKLHGHALYSLRAVSLLMNSKPLIVDYYESVSSVADMAMKRYADKMYDPVVVVKGTKYFGMVAVKDLLQYAVEYERDYARELNPLTKLPGNKIINRVLNDILVYSTKAALFYFDLDHFKAYNDIYGFEKGDQVICLVSQIIQRVIKNRDAINSFVGHIGGDDFVAVMENTEPHVLHDICQEIIRQFEGEIDGFLSDQHKIQGVLIWEDRNGEVLHFKNTSLSIGVLFGELARIPDVSLLAETMATIKKCVKKMPGNAYQILAMEGLESVKQVFDSEKKPILRDVSKRMAAL